MDILDRAQALQEQEVEHALSRRKSLVSCLPSSLWCEECGLDIPEARRVAVAGVQTCVECQQHIEAGRI